MRISFCGNLGAGQEAVIEKLLPMLQEALGNTYKVVSMSDNVKFGQFKLYDFSNTESNFDRQRDIFKAMLNRERICQAMEKDDPNKVILTMGSINETQYAVWRAMLAEKLLSQEEFELLRSQIDAVERAPEGVKFSINDLLVEVHADVDACLSNIAFRGRGEEKHIKKKYLRALGDEIEWFVEQHQRICSTTRYDGCNAWVTPATANEKTYKELVVRIVEKVRAFYKRQIEL